MHGNTTRRRFVQLAAAALAGPLIPLTLKGQENPTRPPLRIITLCDYYGISGDRSLTWMRSETGDYGLTEADLGIALQPLAPFLDKMCVVSGTSMLSRTVVGGSAAHFAVNSQALTGSRGMGNRSLMQHVHPSIDAFAGDFLNDEYGLSSPRIYPHVRLGPAITNSSYWLSYDADGNRIPGPGEPQAVNQAIFGGSDQVGLATSELILETVGRKLQEIRPQLVNANKSTVIDAYHESVQSVAREVELRKDLSCEPPMPNSWPKSSSQAGIELYFDQIYHMLACDLVSSVSLGARLSQKHGWVGTDPLAAEIGATATAANHHKLSHDRSETAALSQAMIYRWRHEQLAKLLARLENTAGPVDLLLGWLAIDDRADEASVTQLRAFLEDWVVNDRPLSDFYTAPVIVGHVDGTESEEPFGVLGARAVVASHTSSPTPSFINRGEFITERLLCATLPEDLPDAALAVDPVTPP